jgi:hypothetical protein
MRTQQQTHSTHTNCKLTTKGFPNYVYTFPQAHLLGIGRIDLAETWFVNRLYLYVIGFEFTGRKMLVFYTLFHDLKSELPFWGPFIFRHSRPTYA